VRLRAATVAAALTVAVAGLAAAPVARAATCGKPDLEDMVPPDGATLVPRNATLAAHYAASAEYLKEKVALVRPDDSEVVLTAMWEPTEQRLWATPPEPLDAGTTYKIVWPPLRGLSAAAPGIGGTATFTTGSAFDTEPPAFVGVVGLSWDLERRQDGCIDEVVERFVFDVDLGAVSDDGGTDELTLMLFQSSGPNVNGMPRPIPARAWPKDGMRARIKLATWDAVGDICFVGIARDTTGQISNSNDVKVCVKTTAPPFFRGCSVSGSGAGPARWNGTLASLALAIAALLYRRRVR
jgi:MYXO-CTERM domain-containing protein